MKSRSLHDECDDIAGLGSFPAGLFAFQREKYCGTKERNAPTMDDYSKTSRVKGNRPEYVLSQGSLVLCFSIHLLPIYCIATVRMKYCYRSTLWLNDQNAIISSSTKEMRGFILSEKMNGLKLGMSPVIIEYAKPHVL